MDFASGPDTHGFSVRCFHRFFMLPFSVKLLRRLCDVSSLFVTVVWKVRLVHLIFAVPQIQEQIVQATARVDVHIFTVVRTRLSRLWRYHRFRSRMLKF